MSPSLGNTLRTVREQRGLSLPDAAHRTHIPVKRLQFLEDDDFAAFGSLTYARSFLRLYSQFLAVDPSSLLEKLPHGRLGGPDDYRYLTATPERWVVKSPKNAVAKDVARISGSPIKSGLALFLLLLAGLGFWGNHVIQEQAHFEKSQAIANAQDEERETRRIYRQLSAQVGFPRLPGEKVTSSLPVGPKDIEKLFSEHTGKARIHGIE